MVRRLLRWIDDQTELITLARQFMEEPLAKGVGWPHVFGSGAMFLFILQLCTGVMLMVYYVPSPNAAHESIRFISTDLPLGRLVRGLHHWGASLMLVVVFVHMLQTFFWGAYKRPRQIIWVIGVFLLLVTLALSFTGYLLPWDQKAYWATVVGTRIAGSVPFVGPYITDLMRGGSDVGALTITRFFSLHVLVFPALLIGLMLFHVAQVRKKEITPPGRKVGEEEGVPHTGLFYPDQVFKDAVLSLLLLAILFAMALLYSAPLEAKADPTATGYVPRPEWYFLPNFQLLKYIPTAWGGWGEFFGAAVIPGLVVLILIALPYLDHNPERRPSRRPLASTAALLGLATLGYLGYAGAMSGPRPVKLTPIQAQGEKIFLDLRCNACHGINGGGGIEGQDLAPDGPRAAERVAEILRYPTKFNPRSIMPVLTNDLSHTQFEALVAYVSAIDKRFHMPRQAEFGPQRPPSHEEENWFANHKYAVYEDPSVCSNCHQPPFCQSCHQNRKPDSHLHGWLKSHFGTARERPEYCQVCHERSFCNTCHDRLLHTPDWMHLHPKAAEADSEICSQCHKPDFCVTCHGGARPASHDATWLHRHGTADTSQCGQCHDVKTFCVNCHQGAKPASHTSTWMERHGKAAQAAKAPCTTCHEQSFCLDCHGGVDMPHPQDWVLSHKERGASFAPGSPCYRCHTYAQKCAQCHGETIPQD